MTQGESNLMNEHLKLDIELVESVKPYSKPEYTAKIKVDLGWEGHALTIGSRHNKMEVLAKAQIEANKVVTDFFSEAIEAAALEKPVTVEAGIGREVKEYIDQTIIKAQQQTMETLRKLFR